MHRNYILLRLNITLGLKLHMLSQFYILHSWNILYIYIFILHQCDIAHMNVIFNSWLGICNFTSRLNLMILNFFHATPIPIYQSMNLPMSWPFFDKNIICLITVAVDIILSLSIVADVIKQWRVWRRSDWHQRQVPQVQQLPGQRQLREDQVGDIHQEGLRQLCQEGLRHARLQVVLGLGVSRRVSW